MSYSEVLGPALEEVEALSLPAGIRLEIDGEARGSSEANASMLRALPIGLALLLFFLLAEFNSFRRVAIVLATVPLAGVGIIPGLILSGQAFGFMSLLGVIALSGIVVNNAIVLIDVIERRRDAGASPHDAIRSAVSLRTRPILLTTVTTVAGLLPLAFSGSSMWPPLAWAMSSGLIASTGLTLLVVPSLYKILLVREPVSDVSHTSQAPATGVVGC